MWFVVEVGRRCGAGMSVTVWGVGEGESDALLDAEENAELVSEESDSAPQDWLTKKVLGHRRQDDAMSSIEELGNQGEFVLVRGTRQLLERVERRGVVVVSCALANGLLDVR
jgi:hypothetical protein